MTLRQNLHQFQAGENTRNPSSDKVFSRIGPQNDPLEGGKIQLIWESVAVAMQLYPLYFSPHDHASHGDDDTTDLIVTVH